MKYLVLMLFATFAFSADLEVKKGDVQILINNEQKSLKKGEKLTLDFGSNICFKEGSGRVVINKRIQLKKPNKCYLVPVPKGFDIKDYIAKAKDLVNVAMIDSSEKVEHGVSTKSIIDLEDGKDILLKKKSDFLVVYSKEFGPYPVFVNLKDEKGNILMSFENEESEITFFKVASSSIKTGYSLEVLNGFEETLINKKIVKE